MHKAKCYVEWKIELHLGSLFTVKLKGFSVSIPGKYSGAPGEYRAGTQLRGGIHLYFHWIQLCASSGVQRRTCWSETQGSKFPEKRQDMLASFFSRLPLDEISSLFLLMASWPPLADSKLKPIPFGCHSAVDYLILMPLLPLSTFSFPTPTLSHKSLFLLPSRQALMPYPFYGQII